MENYLNKRVCICLPGKNYPSCQEVAQEFGSHTYFNRPSNLDWLKEGMLGTVRYIGPYLGKTVLLIKIKNINREILIADEGVRTLNNLCLYCPNRKNKT